MFIGYDSFCGLPVIVKPTALRAEATYDNNGFPVIVIDPSVYKNQTASRIFAIAHECGHHKNGHLSGLGIWKRFHGNGTAAQERGADCWAAEQLALAGLSEELQRVVRDFAAEADPPFWSPYPSGRDRSVGVLLCATRVDPSLPTYAQIVDGDQTNTSNNKNSEMEHSNSKEDPCAPENREKNFFLMCIE